MSYNKLLKTKTDYNNALKRIDEIFDAKKGTAESDELELLVALVELYEKEHFPIEAPDPISAIKFRMEQEGLRTWFNTLEASRESPKCFPESAL